MRKVSIWFLSLMLVAAALFGCMTVMAEETDPAVVQNTATGAVYEDLSKALAEAETGETLILQQDVGTLFLSVPNGVTVDLNGKTLTATYVSAFGNIEDSSAENTGLLKVDANKLLLKKTNSQLPVKTAEGYKFISMRGFNTRVLDGGARYVFQPLFEAAAHEMLKDGAAATGVSVQVLVTWKSGADTDSRTFVFGDNFVTQFVNSYVSTGGYGKMFQLTVSNPEKFEDLKYTARVVTQSGVVYEPGKLPAEVTEDVTIKNDQASAVVAAGTKLTDGDVSLSLVTTEMENTTSSIVVGEGEEARSIDVHVNGLSKDNTVPVIITINEATLNGLNEGNLTLYHVENGAPVEMTRVYSIEEVDVHNEYYYDIPTGNVTMALASFSEITFVADEINPWKGAIDTKWYNTNDLAFNIYNADQLAGFGAIVDGTATDQDGAAIEADTFAGKTVTLCMNVTLSDGRHQDVVAGKTASQMFNPIGYGYDFLTYNYHGNSGVSGKVFAGTFDGNGNTIFNLFMNGWDMESMSEGGEDYTYSAVGAGLFASVKDATIKNLTIDHAQITMECVDMGIVIGYANGNCTFENIVVKNSTIGNYQRCTGGVIGEVGNGHHILKNVDVENSTTVSSLWGDFDAPLGGIIGGRWAHSYNNIKGDDGVQPVTVYMENCDVAAEINAYNDVTSAYQWYSYRRAGMLIGNSEECVSENGRTVATAPYLTTVNCTVQYGDWADYHYCEFGNTTSMNARYPWVRVEDGYSCGAYSNPRYGVPTFAEGLALDVLNHTENDGTHNETDGHLVPISFNQLYGGGQGVYGGNSHIGNGVTYVDATVNKKFGAKFSEVYNKVKEGSTVKLSELFKELDGVNIQDACVYAFVSPYGDNSEVKAVSVAPTADGKWEDMQITFTGLGEATVLISDYYYCTPTVIKVQVVDDLNVNKFKSVGVTKVPAGMTFSLGDLFETDNSTVPVELASLTLTGQSDNGVGVTYTPDATDWTKGAITFTGVGDISLTLQDDYFCNPCTITISTNVNTQTRTCAACGDRTFIEWDGQGQFLPAHYYVADDMSPALIMRVRTGKMVCLDLNGKTVTSDRYRIINVAGNWNLMDSADGGKLVTTFKPTSTDKDGDGYFTFDSSNGSIFYVFAPGKTHIYSGTLESQGFAFNGNIGVIADGAEATLENCTVTGGKALRYGASLRVGGTLTIDDDVEIIPGVHSQTIKFEYGEDEKQVTVSGGQTSEGGGVIAVINGGKLNMTGGTINGGSVVDNGGAIYLETNTTFNMAGGIITGGTANKGGNVAAYVADSALYAQFNMTGGIIENGTARINGGNVNIGTYTTITISGGEIRNGMVTGNPVSQTNKNGVKDYADRKIGIGGNIYCQGTIELKDGYIYGGVVNGNSGGNIALYNNAASMTMSGGKIWGGLVNADNSAAGSSELNYGYDMQGASLYMRYAKSFTMTGGSIGIDSDGNAKGGYLSHGGEGGNLAALGGPSTKVTLSGGTIANGEASKGGNYYGNAAVYIQDGMVIRDGYGRVDGGNIALWSADDVMHISGGTISGGRADSSGGNIVFAGDTTTTAPQSMTITGGTITGGTAKKGGNIAVIRKDNVLTIEADVTLSDGKADEFTKYANGNVGTYGDNVYVEGTLKPAGNVILDGVFLSYDKQGGLVDGTAMTADAKLQINSNTVHTFMTCDTEADANARKGCFSTVWEGKYIKQSGNDLILDYVDVHTDHCVCGGTVENVTEHTCETNVEWKPLPEELKDFADLGEGHWYLTKDLAIKTATTITKGDLEQKNIYLCLHGYAVTTTADATMGYTSAGVHISVCDCSGEQAANGTWSWQGSMSGNTSGDARSYGGIVNIRAGSTLTVYGGNFYGARGGRISSGGVFNVCNDGISYVLTQAQKDEYEQYKATTDDNPVKNIEDFHSELKYSGDYGTCLTIYNGNFEGGELQKGADWKDIVDENKPTAFAGGAINAWHSVTVNIYGGRITGGKADSGGAIYIAGGSATSGAATVVMKNCVITGGEAYLADGASSVHIGGPAKATLENVTINGAQADHVTLLLGSDSAGATFPGEMLFKDLTVIGGLDRYQIVELQDGYYKLISSHKSQPTPTTDQIVLKMFSEDLTA